MKDMRVALVHDYLDSYSGAEKVFACICEIFPEAPIYSLTKDGDIVSQFFCNRRIETSFIDNLPKWLKKNTKFNRKLLLPLLPMATESLDLSEYDLIISSSGAWTKGCITGSHAIHINYSHTPARFLWDYTNEFKSQAGVAKGLKGYLVNSLLRHLRQWDYLSSKRVDRYIANSSITKKRIQKYYKEDAIVIHPNVEVEKYMQDKYIDEGYAFIASRIEKYKMIEEVVEYYADNPSKKLIIAGSGSQLKELMQKFQNNNNIIWKGYVDDSELIDLMQKSSYFIFPAEDDFGIAPVEAMAAGKPVLAIRKGGVLDTVMENETGIFINTTKKEDMAKGVAEIEQAKWDHHYIKNHANSFSKENFKKKIEREIEKAKECLKSKKA